MATDDIETDEETEEGGAPKRSRGPLLIGLVLFLLMGGGGFFGVYSGLVPLPGGKEAHAAPKKISYELTGEEPAFVEVGHMTIPLGPDAKAAFLHIDTQLEVAPEYAADIEKLRPRILDVFNTFLRAVDEKDIEEPGSTIRLRAQLLRRAKAVTAPFEPRDLLITAFVLK